MEAKTRQLELTAADLLGYTPDALACDLCTSGCGHRIARILDGGAFIMCSRKDETREVLASIKRR